MKLYHVQEVMIDNQTRANFMKFRIHGYRATFKVRLSEFAKFMLYNFLSWFALRTDLALSPNLLTFKAVYRRIELVRLYFSKLYRVQEVVLDHQTRANCMKFRIHGYRATSKMILSEFEKSLILYKFPHNLHL